MMRHTDPPVRGYAVTHPVGEVSLPTEPGWDQIIYARHGLFRARTEHGTWTVPAHRALCLGDGSTAVLDTRERTAVRCLYLRRELGALTADIRVISVPALTRELLLHAVESSPLDMRVPVEAALVTLVIDRLRAETAAPLHLPLPGDPRAVALADALRERPARTLDEAIDGVGASRRTLERLFRRETAMTLAAWHRRARILAAIELMAAETPVTTAATTVGYATPSSFVAAFRSELGETPRAFMSRS